MTRIRDWIGDWYDEHPTLLFLVILAVLLTAGMVGYLESAYDTVPLDAGWRDKVIEGANYASQTVTTVGYGNIDPGPGSHHNAKQRIRFFSAFYALIAPFVWVLLIQRMFGRASYS